MDVKLPDLAPYSGAIESVTGFLDGIMKRVFPEKMSDEAAAKMRQELTQAVLNGQLQQVLAQLQVNEKEAEHDSVFVAGWRPFIGWVCGSALAYHFILQPSLVFFVVWYKWSTPPLPSFDVSSLMTILLGMLGLGAMRSYEKVKGETTTATKVGA